MSYGNIGQSWTCEAGAAITKYRFVKRSDVASPRSAAVYKAILCTAGDWYDGISDKTVDSGENFTVNGPYSGHQMVEAGNTVAAGADVTPDANGRAVTAASGDYKCGKALTAASAAGDRILVALYGTPTTVP